MNIRTTNCDIRHGTYTYNSPSGAGFGHGG